MSLLIIDPQHPGAIYAASPSRHGLFKSTNGAATWSMINSGLSVSGGFPALITALAMDSEDSSVRYAGTYMGSPAVFMTKDGGLTWTAASPEFGSSDGKCCAWISTLVADPRRSGAVYAAIDRRRILHFAVTAHPTAEWTAQQRREAFPWDRAPRFLLRGRDRIFGADFTQQVKELGIQEVLGAPRQRAYIERVIGTIRRECLDHV